MDYAARDLSGAVDEGAAEVREPAVAYARAYASGGAVVGSDWDDDLGDDAEYDANGDWFERALRADPELMEAVCSELEQAAADIKAGRGRMYTTEEVRRHLGLPAVGVGLIALKRSMA